MAQIVRNRVRIKGDIAKNDAATDVLLSETPVFRRNMDNQVELGIFNNAVLITNLANILTVTMEIKDSDNPGAPAYISKTLTLAQLDATLADATWTDGSKQHALFTLTNIEMNLPAKGDTQQYWIVIYALTNDATALRIELAYGTIVMREPGAGLGDAQTPFYTTAEADARFMQQLNSVANFRQKNNLFQLYNSTTALWHTIQASGPAGSVVIAVDQTGEA